MSFKTIRLYVLLKTATYVECKAIYIFGSEGQVPLDRNPGAGYNTLLLRLIPGDLLSACPHRQLDILPGLSDSRAALSNSYPNSMRAYAGRQFVPFL